MRQIENQTFRLLVKGGKLKLGNGKYPDGWYERYMGFGNHLLIHKSILPEIIEKTKNIEDPAVLYQNWLRIVTEVLKNSN